MTLCVEGSVCLWISVSCSLFQSHGLSMSESVSLCFRVIVSLCQSHCLSVSESVPLYQSHCLSVSESVDIPVRVSMSVFVSESVYFFLLHSQFVSFCVTVSFSMCPNQCNGVLWVAESVCLGLCQRKLFTVSESVCLSLSQNQYISLCGPLWNIHYHRASTEKPQETCCSVQCKMYGYIVKFVVCLFHCAVLSM